MRRPKILLPISNVRHFSRSFSPCSTGHTYLTCLPSYLLPYPRTSTSTNTPSSTLTLTLLVCICVRLSTCDRVRASFPLFDTRAHGLHRHTPTPTSASASASPISHLHLHRASAPWTPYVARAAPPRYPNTTAGLFPLLRAKYWGLSARQLGSCLACHRQSRSVLHCYLLHYPTQPARCVSA